MSCPLPEPIVRLLATRHSKTDVSPDELALLCEWVTLKDLTKVDEQVLAAMSSPDAPYGDEIYAQLLAAMTSRRKKHQQKVADLDRQMADLRLAQENPETTLHDMEHLSRSADQLAEQLRQLQMRRKEARKEWDNLVHSQSGEAIDSQGGNGIALDGVVISPLSSLSYAELIVQLADREAQCVALKQRVKELTHERLQLRWDLRILHNGLADELLLRTSRFPRAKCADLPVLGKLTYLEMARYLAEHEFASATQSAAGWAAMGRTVGPTGVVSGTKLSQRDCFLEAVRRDVTVSKAWSALASVMLPAEPGVAISDEVGQRTQLQCFVESVRCDPRNTSAWVSIGNLLKANVPAKPVTVFGRPMTPVVCYREALRFDPSCVDAWMAMGNALGIDELVVVGPGKRSKKHCFIKVLQFSRGCAPAWYNLGQLLGPAETVVAGGAPVTKLKCFVESVRIDPTNADAWNNIAAHMGPEQEPIVVQNTTFSQLDCIIQALRVEPKLGSAWANLASLMSSEDDVELDGAVLNKRQCIVEALKCDATNADMWGDLGAELKPKEQLTVPGTGPVNAKECFRRALQLGPATSQIVRCLMALMSDQESVQISGRPYTKAQLMTLLK